MTTSGPSPPGASHHLISAPEKCFLGQTGNLSGGPKSGLGFGAILGRWAWAWRMVVQRTAGTWARGQEFQGVSWPQRAVATGGPQTRQRDLTERSPEKWPWWTRDDDVGHPKCWGGTRGEPGSRHLPPHSAWCRPPAESLSRWELVH